MCPIENCCVLKYVLCVSEFENNYCNSTYSKPYSDFSLLGTYVLYKNVLFYDTF